MPAGLKATVLDPASTPLQVREALRSVHELSADQELVDSILADVNRK